MLMDQQQLERRNAIVRILKDGSVRNQGDLVRLLKKEGYAVTQSSVSRDLRDLGVLKASDGYVLPPEDAPRTHNGFDALVPFVRAVKTAGPCLIVIKTTIGSAQSVAVALDKAEWPEVIGTLSGDDTIFIATDSSRAQAKIIERLRATFRV